MTRLSLGGCRRRRISGGRRSAPRCNSAPQTGDATRKPWKPPPLNSARNSATYTTTTTTKTKTKTMRTTKTTRRRMMTRMMTWPARRAWTCSGRLSSAGEAGEPEAEAGEEAREESERREEEWEEGAVDVTSTNPPELEEEEHQEAEEEEAEEEEAAADISPDTPGARRLRRRVGCT